MIFIYLELIIFCLENIRFNIAVYIPEQIPVIKGILDFLDPIIIHYI